MEAGCEKIWLKGSGIFYKIYNIYFAPNCPGRIVAPNCPRRIVRAELSCAELSGHRMVKAGASLESCRCEQLRGTYWALPPYTRRLKG